MAEIYPQIEYPLAAAQLVFAMLGMGATLRPADFGGVVRAPRGVILGVFCQLLVVPALAFALMRLFPLGPGIAVGLALVAAVPGGSVSNIFTYLAGGNAALSISLTAISTTGCLVTTPIVLDVLVARDLPPGFVMPAGRIAFEIGAALLTPLAVGMAIGMRLTRRGIERFSKTCIRTSLFLIGCMVVGSLGAGRVDAGAQGIGAVALVIAFCSLNSTAGHTVSRILGLARVDEVAIAIETTVRNTNLGLLLKASLFPATAGAPSPVADAALFVLLFYGGTALVAAQPIIFLNRWRDRRAGAGATGENGSSGQPPRTSTLAGE